MKVGKHSNRLIYKGGRGAKSVSEIKKHLKLLF